MIRELSSAYSEDTDIIADHRLIDQPFPQSAASSDAAVYEGRKNSSAIRRLSTPSQNGKLPSTLRVPGNDMIPAVTVKRSVEGVAQVPGEHDLGAQTLRSI